MNNADDFAKGLSEIAEEMLALSETPRKVAELAVPKIQALLEQEIASGVDPSGQTWEPLKNGSGRIPFSSPRHGKDAMKPTVRAVGTFVVAKIGGWANVHQNSKRASLPQRQLVPRGGLTLAWEHALEEAAEEAVKELAPKLAEGGGISKR